MSNKIEKPKATMTDVSVFRLLTGEGLYGNPSRSNEELMSLLNTEFSKEFDKEMKELENNGI